MSKFLNSSSEILSATRKKWLRSRVITKTESRGEAGKLQEKNPHDKPK